VADSALVAGIVFVAVLLQATIFASLDVLGGTPDILLLALLGIALLRGAITGAVAGFFGGLLLDIVSLDTLGVTALILALAGYWTGRYGETTGRSRAHAPILAVIVLTILVALFGFFLHFLLGEEVSMRRALVEALIAGLGLNLIFGGPVLALCRSLLERGGVRSPAEVRLLG